LKKDLPLSIDPWTQMKYFSKEMQKEKTKVRKKSDITTYSLTESDKKKITDKESENFRTRKVHLLSQDNGLFLIFLINFSISSLNRMANVDERIYLNIFAYYKGVCILRDH